MKHILLTLALALSITSGSFAQLPDGSIAPDFTATDVNGNTHRLYDYLDAGYTVILDISATWCGPCWNYHSGGTFEDIWKFHGPAGEPGVDPNTTDDVIILWFEGDSQTPLSELTNSNLGNWLQPVDSLPPVDFPIINDDNIASLYNLPYWPIIYTICPSKIISVSGQATASAHYANLAECATAFEGTNANLASYNGNLSADGCENSGTGNVSVTVHNFGTEILTDFTVEVIENGNSIASEDYSGSLDVYDIVNIDFGNLTINSTEFEIAITTEDDVPSDNVISQTLSFANSTNENTITITIATDNYPGETSWKLKSGNGTVIESFGPYQEGDGNMGAGGPDANATFTYDVALPEGLDCYELEISDTYGDGLSLANAAGYGVTANGVELIDNFTNPNFGVLVSDYFSADSDGNGTVSAINELENVSVSVYPNPVSSNATVEISTVENSDVTLSLINILGELISSNIYNLNAGNNKVNLNVNNLESGIYFVQLNINGLTTTKKITVSK
jgi:hypothetical protein